MLLFRQSLVWLYIGFKRIHIAITVSIFSTYFWDTQLLSTYLETCYYNSPSGWIVSFSTALGPRAQGQNTSYAALPPLAGMEGHSRQYKNTVFCEWLVPNPTVYKACIMAYFRELKSYNGLSPKRWIIMIIFRSMKIVMSPIQKKNLEIMDWGELVALTWCHCFVMFRLIIDVKNLHLFITRMILLLLYIRAVCPKSIFHIDFH